MSLPKTEAGLRTVLVPDAVKDAFGMEWEEQVANGGKKQVIDEYHHLRKSDESVRTGVMH